MKKFIPGGLPLLIGSLPVTDHKEALNLILEHTPEIPLWAQLPANMEEGMISQFVPGFPGVETRDDKIFINTSGKNFDEEVLGFYEDYISITDAGASLKGSRFELTEKTAQGFFELTEYIRTSGELPVAIKGQITGPVTFGTGLADQDGRAVFFDDQLKDITIKHLAFKGKWQAAEFAGLGALPVIFFDEPALAGYGTSAYITITKEEVTSCINEVVAAVRDEGGLTGVHVCANTEWPLLFDSDLDIISFDAYAYFDKFILYEDKIKRFFEKGGILAWGIVPTLNSESINSETTDSLEKTLHKQIEQVESIGIDREKIISQILITPSCGTGSLSLEDAIKVLRITKELSQRIRS